MGRVVSYSVVHEALESFKMLKPYVIALIELEEGVRITAPLACNPKDVKIGMKVKAAFRSFGEEGEDGIIYYGTKFVPVT